MLVPGSTSYEVYSVGGSLQRWVSLPQVILTMKRHLTPRWSDLKSQYNKGLGDVALVQYLVGSPSLWKSYPVLLAVFNSLPVEGWY